MSVRSVPMPSPPGGGVSPGASRWSAARADDGPAWWTQNAMRTIAPIAATAADGPAAAKRDAVTRLVAGLSTGDTAGYVRKLERRAAAHPQDADALTLLGLSYQQRAREAGDPTFYRLSGEALRRAASSA